MNKLLPIIILIVIFFSLFIINNFVLAGSISPVIINEILFDPEGSDSPKEWIELYNNSNNVVEIVNWKILVAGSSFQESAILNATIQPFSYFLICESAVAACDVYVPKLAMQNGGGATDAISIVDNKGTIVDQVFYDLPNTYSLKDMFGNVVQDNQTSLIGKSGETIGRDNFIDTNNSSEDFYIYSTPTPRAKNFSQIVDEELPQTGSFLLTYLILLIFIFSGILLARYNLLIFNHGKKYKDS